MTCKRLPINDLDFICKTAEDLFLQFRDQNIFITGITGFFGKWLLESLIYANDKLSLNLNIYGLSRDPQKFLNCYPYLKQHKNLNLIKGNVLDFSLKSVQCKYLIHAATDASAELNNHNPELMLNTITKGTENILNFAKSCKVEHFLFVSSGAVYGRQPPNISHIEEDYIGAPNCCDQASAYGEGKRAAELLAVIRSKTSDINTKIARCFAFVGPYLPIDKHFAIGNFIQNGLQGKKIIIKGDGTPLRSYLYSADLVIWLLTVLIKGKSCRPYNVGSDKAISIEELARCVSQKFNNIEIEILKPKNTNTPILQYVPSVSRAQKELGLKIYTDLETSLIKTIDWQFS